GSQTLSICMVCSWCSPSASQYCFGSRASCSPSPTTLKARTVTKIASPGHQAIQGAWLRNPCATLARNHKDLLDDDSAAKEGASLQSQDGDHGYQRVAQGVFRDYGAFREPFGARRLYIVGL